MLAQLLDASARMCDGEKGFDVYDEIYPAVVESIVDVPEAMHVHISSFTSDPQQGRVAVLASGGLDSFIAYRLACRLHGDHAVPVRVAFDTPYNAKEALAAEALYGDDLVTIDLTRWHLNRSPEWKHIIPLRNAICIVAAAPYGAHEIQIAALEGELRGDKSTAFMAHMSLLTGRVVTSPFLGATKNRVVRMAISEDLASQAELQATITCFAGEWGHCGKCRACLRRWMAFRYAGMLTHDGHEGFEVHPLVGAKEEADRYRRLMADAIGANDFSTYSEKRCSETLALLRE